MDKFGLSSKVHSIDPSEFVKPASYNRCGLDG